MSRLGDEKRVSGKTSIFVNFGMDLAKPLW